MSATAAPPAIGWPLLPLPGPDGSLAFPSLQDSIRQMIEVILRTRPGEQLMRPEFGAGVEELLHEPNDVGTRRRLRDLVTGALGRWEPRIDLLSVDVNEIPDRPSEVRLEIAYRVRRTGGVERVGAVLEIGG